MAGRILIVEDDPELRQFYALTLALAGFDTEVAADGLSALRLIDQQLPAAVILDLGLPLLAGQGVLSELAANAHTRDIPVIVVTGQPAIEVPAAAACLLRKPVSAFDLVTTVRRCLQQPSPGGTVG